MAQGGKRAGAGRPQVFPWDTMDIGDYFIAEYNVSSTSKYWTRKFPHLSFSVTRTKDSENRTVWRVTRLS